MLREVCSGAMFRGHVLGVCSFGGYVLGACLGAVLRGPCFGGHA